METIYHFLIFRRFISPQVLFAAYYLGAVVVPLVLWIVLRRLRHRSALIREHLSLKGRGWCHLTLLFVIVEILWRMAFEFLFAFLQMRDALLRLAGY